MKYQFIAKYSQDYPVARMCRVLGVARSGYYAWEVCPSKPREQANEALTKQVQTIFGDSHQTYGSRRIAAALQRQGIPCSRGRVMRRAGLSVPAQHRRVVTTHAAPGDPTGENMLARDFSAQLPNQKWVVDITYVATEEGYLYVAGVLDLFSRKIVGWAMDDNMRDELTQAALHMALLTRRPDPGLLHHSDRGSQYTSTEYQAIFREYGILVSLSRAANCFDNAPMESFWGKLKTECLYRHHFTTRAEAKTVIFAYIEAFYNRQRLHSTLGYCSPDEFELTAWTT